MLEILGKIGFDWQVALANFINFVIIFFILKKFAFGPIKKVIDERQKKIDEGLDNATQAETNLMLAEEIKNQKIEEAKIKSNQLIGQAQTKSNELLADVKKEAQKIKDKIVADGELAAKEAKNRIQREVEREMSAMIITGVEKVLKENINPEMQKDYITKSLNNFKTR